MPLSPFTLARRPLLPDRPGIVAVAVAPAAVFNFVVVFNAVVVAIFNVVIAAAAAILIVAVVVVVAATGFGIAVVQQLWFDAFVFNSSVLLLLLLLLQVYRYLLQLFLIAASKM